MSGIDAFIKAWKRQDDEGPFEYMLFMALGGLGCLALICLAVWRFR